MPQATIREPAKKNMYKGICLAYSVITTTYWLVAFLGYWAFGFAVQAYVVNSFSGPNWAITMANVFAVIQVAGCFQVCYKPITHYHIPNKSTSLVHGFLSVLANIITESSPPPSPNCFWKCNRKTKETHFQHIVVYLSTPKNLSGGDEVSW
jgi:hypothetical protein